MSSIKTTQIDGDVSVGRNVAIGGQMDVAGNATIGHNLKVKGWLDAPNIKNTNKGIFTTLQKLETAIPNPKDGWLAGVGTSTPFSAYVAENGEWVATGGTIDIDIEILANTIAGYVAIGSVDELPESPTAEQQQKGWLLGTVLYVYVGEGGDTLGGKWQSADLKGVKGDKGDSGVHLGDVALVNDLTTGGEQSALSAEMGKTLKQMIDNGTSIDTSVVTNRYSLLEGYGYDADKILKADGTLQDKTGLGIRTYDYIPVTAGTYYCHCRCYAMYDESKVLISSEDSGANSYGKFYTINMPSKGYIRVSVDCGTDCRLALASEKYKTRADYAGYGNIYNPMDKPCDVVLCGDSNTAGYGLTDTTEAWSGLFKAAFDALPETVRVNPLLYAGCFVNKTYSGMVCLATYGKAYIKVYTDTLTLHFQYVGTVKVNIEGVAQTDITSASVTYDLELGLHEVELIGSSGANNVFDYFEYRQARSFTNLAVTGTNTTKLDQISLGSGNLFIVMYGTNDRSLNYGETMSQLAKFTANVKRAGKEVILLSPIPPAPSGETDPSYKINIGQVMSQSMSDVQIPLYRYIDTYSVMQMYYILYTKLNSTAIYNDGLHLNRLGHRLLWSAIAPQLGFALNTSQLL